MRPDESSILPEQKLREYLHVAMEAAYAGGSRTLAYFNAGLASAQIEEKSDETPVTRADKEAELVIREVIAKFCPGHSVLGEEHGRTQGDPDYTWVIDPIDGTKSFIHGVPFYGAVVGLIVKGTPVVGSVYLPALGDMYGAAHGLGATWNGRVCKVSTVSQLKDATLLAGSITRCIDRSDAYMTLARQVKLNRGWGDVFGYMMIASGRAEMMLDPRITVWDIAGVAPIVREAGGWLGDWSGIPTVEGKDCVAVNMAMKETVLGVLKNEKRV